MHRSLGLTAVAGVTVLAMSACGGLTNSADDPPATNAKGALTADACADPAAATKRITGSVKIGWTVPLSGPYAGVWNLIDDGFKARMALLNKQGGAGGVPADFFTTDSQLNPEVAKAMGNEMIQKDGADIVSTTGTAQVATMVDDSTAACVPMIAATSSDPTYQNAKTFPWATMYLPSVQLEADAIVKATERLFPDGAKVALGLSSSETGSIYAAAYKKAVKGTDIDIVTSATLDDPNAAASTLKASGATVLFSGASAQECLAMTTAISRVGWKPTVFQDATCADSSLYAPAGSAADGQRVFKYEIVPSLASFAGQPATKQYLAEAKSVGLKDPLSNWSVTGWSIGEVYADVLTRAAQAKGGLTRLSIMQAARDQNFHPATVIKGINYDVATGGITGMQPFRWDAAAQQFELDGAPVIINK